MGGCFSKRNVSSSATSSSSPPPSQPPPISTLPSQQKKKKKKEASHQQQALEPAFEKKHVFAITQNSHNNNNNQQQQQQISNTAQEKVTKEEEKRVAAPPSEKKTEIPKKNPCGDDVMVEESRVVPLRISSCTKEEVDAILIQCGRLSRSSSGKTPNENGGRKYSGSKRSFDFDNEKKDEEEEEEDWEKPQSRPSPRRRAGSRERDGGECKRSGSRERGSGGGGRRVSRSPGKRSDGPAVSDKSRVPGKMVSVPAREKGIAVGEAGGIGGKRAPAAAGNRRGGDVGGLRSSSPRSRSPANSSRVSNENAHHSHPPPPQQPQSLSRSSSRKADQSPYRRNPMSEIDENSLRAEQPLSRNQTHNGNNHHKVKKNREGDEGVRKPSHQQSQKANESTVQLRKSELRNGGIVETSNGSNSNSNVNMKRGVREQLMSCRAMEQQLPGQEIVEEAVETKGPLKGLEVDTLNPRIISRTRSSRRSSRDLDMNLAFNPDNLLNQASYASLLLEDIQNYHQQKTTAVSLPACVSKACSILEAVADLNSSFSDNKSSEAGHAPSSLHGRFSRMGLGKDPFVESEVVVKDDIMEPSLHKYVSVRDVGGEIEPQESAGSNSFIGQPWAASSWEPNSMDSTDNYWNSQSNDGEEEVEKEEFSSLGSDLESRGRRLRSSSTSNSLSAASVLTGNGKKKDFNQHQNWRGSNGAGGSGKVGVGRASALPASVSASS